MAHYEPLDAIMDVPAVQEARSGEPIQEKSVELPPMVYVLHVCLVHAAHTF